MTIMIYRQTITENIHNDYPGSAWLCRLSYDQWIQELLVSKLSLQSIESASQAIRPERIIQLMSGYGWAAKRCVERYPYLGVQQAQWIPSALPNQVWQVLPINRLSPDFIDHNQTLLKDLISKWQVNTFNSQLLDQPKHEMVLKDKHDFLESITRPFLKRYLNLNLPNIDLLNDDLANISWRSWFVVEHRAVMLQAPNLTPSSWAIRQGIHDATHLAQLASRSDLQGDLTPQQMIDLEALAMYAEFEFLRHLHQHPNKMFLGQISAQSLIHELWWGFLERALRVDFDLKVHAQGVSIEDWQTRTLGQTQLPRSIVAFVKTFHGLPGFASAYMAGLKAILASPDIQSIIDGRRILDWTSVLKGGNNHVSF